MLKSFIKYGLGIVVIVLFFYSLTYVNTVRDTNVLGSINDGGAYNSTTTDSTYANAQRQFSGGTTELKSGILGSVIVTGTSATVVEIKDATSTTDLASTTLAVFAASPATGTYTFDSAFTRGLRINFLGSFAGKYTVTWK